MLLKILLPVIILVSFAWNLFSAAMPSLIAYQGILTSNSGVPVKDSSGYKLTFSIFDDSASSSSPLWSGNHNVQTKNGVFSFMLGSVNTTGNFDSLKFDKLYWLSVKRDDGAQFGPKIKLSVVPYAKRAMIADSAGKAALASNAAHAQVSDSTLKIDGKNITNASVDSSKLADSTITTRKIKKGTIQSEDVNLQFKAPFAILADSAKKVELTILKTQFQQIQKTGSIGSAVTAGKYYKLVTGCSDYGKVRIKLFSFNYELHNIVEWINDYSMASRGSMKILNTFSMNNGLLSEYLLDVDGVLWGKARVDATGSSGVIYIMDGAGDIANFAEGTPANAVTTVTW
jgi:hypothetical protein